MKPLLYKTYLAMIANSPKTMLYRKFFTEIDGQTVDIIQNGRLACAFFVSNILKTFGWAEPTVTVRTLLKQFKDLNSRWYEIKTPRPGCVIFWEERTSADGLTNAHVGFCLDSNYAISNDPKLGYPVKHHITYGTDDSGRPMRKIIAAYEHKDFQQK